MSADSPIGKDDIRMRVLLARGESPAAVAKCVSILARQGEIFNRAGTLVRLVKLREARALGLRLPTDEVKITRDATSIQPIVVALTSDFLRSYLERHVRFYRIDGRLKQEVPADCPAELAKAILAQGDWDGIPKLRAVTSSPFLRVDGTICNQEGYDVETSTILVASGRLPKVPHQPTVEDADEALALLLDVFGEVPWKDDVALVSYLALLLTLITRPILPQVPAFILTSPVAGSGKSLLVDCASLIVHGSTATRRTFTGDKAEMRKVLQAVMLAGDPLLLFDNVRAGTAVGDDTLNAYITGDTVGDRTLGLSSVPRIMNSSVFALTGNNIGARADFVRRTIAVALDPRMERPETRHFKIANLKDYVSIHRPKLLRSLLTIVAAYIAAGAPQPDHEIEPMGGFDEWDRLVRGCVIWSTGLDPKDTQTALRADDPDAEAALAVFQALHRRFRRFGFTVAELKPLLDPHEEGKDEELIAAVRDALRDPNEVGYWLRKHKDQWRGEYQLVKVEDTKRSAKWCIRKRDKTS